MIPTFNDWLQLSPTTHHCKLSADIDGRVRAVLIEDEQRWPGVGGDLNEAITRALEHRQIVRDRLLGITTGTLTTESAQP